MSTLAYATPLNSQHRFSGTLVVNWALFLGMSWTWCIGLFLPVLLVRDFGIWGWVVFAIPNVIGAAAMGWVISAEGSSRICAAHSEAIRVFSIITIAFQLFFLVFIQSQVGIRSTWLNGIGAMLLVLFAAAQVRAQTTRLASLAVFLISVVAGIGWMQSSSMVITPDRMRAMASFEPFNVRHISLATSCIFGFGLCPYLDATFHRARQQLNATESQAAFGIGFGVFFFMMIVLSLMFSAAVASRTFLASNYAMLPAERSWLLLLWLAQLGFTAAAHLMDPQSHGRRRIEVGGMAVALAIVAVAAMGMIPSSRHLSGELVYRTFMSFYGLAAPAYVWLCMIPFRGGRPTTRSLIVCAAAIITALPTFWLAFIENRIAWASLGVAVVVAARLLVRTDAKAA